MRHLVLLSFIASLAAACGGTPIPPPPPLPEEVEAPAKETATDTVASESGNEGEEAPAAADGSGSTCADGESCFKEGTAALEAEPKKAAAAFEAGCNMKHAMSCVTLGQMTYSGVVATGDPPKAFGLFQTACDLGSAIGCGNVGVMKLKGLGTSKDESAALPLLLKSCEGKYGEGCFNAGLLVLNGVGTAKDEKRALELFKSACANGNDSGCKAEKQLTTAASSGGGGGATTSANVTVGSMTVDGFTVNNLACNLEGGGFFAATATVGTLAAQKKALHRCIKKESPKVSWKFKGGKATDIVVDTPNKKMAACVTKAMKKVKGSLAGECSAVLVGK